MLNIILTSFVLVLSFLLLFELGYFALVFPLFYKYANLTTCIPSFLVTAWNTSSFIRRFAVNLYTPINIPCTNQKQPSNGVLKYLKTNSKLTKIKVTSLQKKKSQIQRRT